MPTSDNREQKQKSPTKTSPTLLSSWHRTTVVYLISLIVVHRGHRLSSIKMVDKDQDVLASDNGGLPCTSDRGGHRLSADQALSLASLAPKIYVLY